MIHLQHYKKKTLFKSVISLIFVATNTHYSLFNSVFIQHVLRFTEYFFQQTNVTDRYNNKNVSKLLRSKNGLVFEIGHLLKLTWNCLITFWLVLVNFCREKKTTALNKMLCSRTRICRIEGELREHGLLCSRGEFCSFSWLCVPAEWSSCQGGDLVWHQNFTGC